MYKVSLSRKAEKDLDSLESETRERVISALQAIATNPFVGKKLAGAYSSFWSHRVWPYRIIYEVYKKELLVMVIRVGHRQGVYKSL